MHKQILNQQQIQLLPFLRNFKREYYLVGGTAIALQIGHRRSIDFDLFKEKTIHPKTIVLKIEDTGYPYIITRRVTEQLNVSILDVKFTFFQYPFQIAAPVVFENYIKMPQLLDLAAMKAYAFGRRSKWKDYVDMYFFLRDYFSVEQISERAVRIFDQLYSPKLFRAQLSYFDDINYSEPVEYFVPVPADDEIKQFLVNKATDF